MTFLFSNDNNNSQSVYQVLYGIFTILFFVSGGAGLIYEVVWMRKLSLFFGSDIFASSITLAAFMGGLALGGYICGFFIDKIRNHIFCYGVLEILIGLYAISFSKFLGFFDPLIAFTYTYLFETMPLLYQFLRGCIAFIVLIIPTIMMGATLPIILKVFTPDASKFGRIAGHFYAINTFGALFGVLLAGFITMPLYGLRVTNIIAIGLNIFIGLACILIPQIRNYRASFDVNANAIQSNTNTVTECPKGVSERQLNWKKAAYIAIGVSGFGGLALEVVWVKILIQSFSANVYSFSLMLISFLLGIALGSKLVSRHLDSLESSINLLAKIEIAIALSVVILACLSYAIPTMFGIFVWGTTAISVKLFSFASVAGALIISVLFMLPSAILLGAAFPSALKIYNLNFASTGENSGHIVFINTFGAVSGALITGLVLIPLIGSKNSLLVLGIIFFINGLYVHQSISNNLVATLKKFAIQACILAVFAIATAFIPNQIVLNYNMQKNTHPNVVYHAEGISGVVDVIKNPGNKVILSIDGNIEADTSLKQLRHFILKAHLPLMLSSNAQEVLIVGLGLGITTSSVLKHPDVKRVDVVELLPSVLVAQKYLTDINGDMLLNPKLNIRIDDGRNFLKFTKNKYDLITADPIHPRISGVGVLYTKEYYRLMCDRLKDSGVVLQWMPLYSISDKSFEIAVRTMAEVFSNTSVWYVPGHILFLGTKTDRAVFDYEILKGKFQDKNVASDLKSIGINNISDLLRLQIMSPEQLNNFLNRNLSNKIVNTEDFPYLEYHTPFEYLTSAEENIRVLLPYSGNDDRLIRNAPRQFLEVLSNEQELYRNSILNNM